ncbi:MAG: hypothetical protein HY313_01030 [Acidobacteria bacterium]|nr:hypothetical protein [Acidobacteriota bacterium]
MVEELLWGIWMFLGKATIERLWSDSYVGYIETISQTVLECFLSAFLCQPGNWEPTNGQADGYESILRSFKFAHFLDNGHGFGCGIDGGLGLMQKGQETNSGTLQSLEWM